MWFSHILVATAEDNEMSSSIALFALMVTLATVGAASCSHDASAGIGGSLTYYGGPGGVHTREAGEVRVLDEAGREVARQSVKRGDGFGFTLSPGTYRLIGISGDANCKDSRVTLAAGQFVDLEIACQIR